MNVPTKDPSTGHEWVWLCSQVPVQNTYHFNSPEITARSHDQLPPGCVSIAKFGICKTRIVWALLASKRRIELHNGRCKTADIMLTRGHDVTDVTNPRPVSGARPDPGPGPGLCVTSQLTRHVVKPGREVARAKAE